MPDRCPPFNGTSAIKPQVHLMIENTAAKDPKDIS